MIFQNVISAILILGHLIVLTIWEVKNNQKFSDWLSWFLKPVNLFTIMLYFFAASLAFILYFKDYYLFTSLEILVSIIGILFFIAGLTFASWARIYMGKFWTPSHNGHNFKEQSVLHTGGPFKYSRNPIYVGLFISGIGFFLALNSYLIIVMGVIYWYFNKSIKEEETLLKKYFGKKYELYTEKVSRFLSLTPATHD